MKAEIIESNRKKINDAISNGVDIVDFITGVVEYDENAPLVIPSDETMYFIARGFSWFLSPHLSRVSNNINILILCSAAEKYTLRLIEAQKNARMYVDNNYMTAEQAQKYYEKKRTESFSIEVTFSHFIDNLKLVKENKKIYPYLVKYKEEMEEYSCNLSFEDKKNKNIFSRNLISGIDIISKATNERDQAIINKFKGGFVRVWIKDPYLLNLQGDAATIEMLERIKLDRKLSLQLYDYFSKKGFLIFEGIKKDFKDEFSIAHFRVDFCINRNDPYVKVAIDDANSKLRYDSEDDLENYYRMICSTAKFQKKKYLANVEQYNNRDSEDDGVSKKTQLKDSRAAKDVYPYDRDEHLIIEIKKACEEIKTKTRYYVELEVVKEILRGYTLIFRCTPNEENIEKLKKEKEEFKAGINEKYPDIDKMHVKEHARKVEMLRRAYFKKEEEEVEKAIAEKYSKDNRSVSVDVSPEQSDSKGEKINHHEEKTAESEEDLEKIKAAPKKVKGGHINLYEKIEDEEIEYYTNIVRNGDKEIPYEYTEDIGKMTRCLMVLSHWNYFVSGAQKKEGEFTPELDTGKSVAERARVVLETLAKMATTPIDHNNNGAVIKANVMIDRFNELCKGWSRGEEYLFIPLRGYVESLTDKYKEILLDEGVGNKKAYLKTCIYNDWSDWKLQKDAKNYCFEKDLQEGVEGIKKPYGENAAHEEAKKHPRNAGNRFNQFPTRERDFEEDAKKIFD